MKTVAVTCQKFDQSILEPPPTDEIHMEDRKKVWPELNAELSQPQKRERTGMSFLLLIRLKI